MVQAGVFSPAWVLMSGNQNHPVIMGMNGVPESSVIIRDWRRDRGRWWAFGGGDDGAVFYFLFYIGSELGRHTAKKLPKTANKMGFFGLPWVAMSRDDLDAQSLETPVFISFPRPTGGRDRTDTFLRILDFESSASANSATPAWAAFGFWPGCAPAGKRIAPIRLQGRGIRANEKFAGYGAGAGRLPCKCGYQKFRNRGRGSWGVFERIRGGTAGSSIRGYRSVNRPGSFFDKSMTQETGVVSLLFDGLLAAVQVAGFVCRNTGLKACALFGRAFSPQDATDLTEEAPVSRVRNG